MCVFDPSGALIDSNDDSNGLLSKVITELSVDGEYRAAVTTFPDFDCIGDGNTSPVFGMGRYILDMSLYEQPAGELIFNGSFELGFDGWTAFEDGSPFIPWSIGQFGGGSGFGMQPLQPQDGSNVAWNGFDGAAGTRFIMQQDLTEVLNRRHKYYGTVTVALSRIAANRMWDNSSCAEFAKRLEDVDQKVLSRLIKASVKEMHCRYVKN